MKPSKNKVMVYNLPYLILKAMLKCPDFNTFVLIEKINKNGVSMLFRFYMTFKWLKTFFIVSDSGNQGG